MSGINKLLVIVVVTSLGLWGCARGPMGSASAERIKTLEYKMAKLEEDFRAAAGARDVLRQKLGAAEEQRAHLEDEVGRLQLVVKERDELKKQVTVRTQERDVLQTQYDQFRKGLKELLGQAEAAMNTTPAQPVTAISVVATPGHS